ncbi:MAG: nucleotidyltransferase family protein [Planctomycetes bacterium]|nr:nucleotidyltransferase family protein [Planctomycetota bacterium]
MRHERAVEKVHERMVRTARALEAAGIPYAVIGGNAVAAWVGSKDPGAIRNTKDVDILLQRPDLQQAAAAMSAAGFDLAEVSGVTMFLDREDPMPSRAVHIIFAGEKIKSTDPCPAPPVKVGIRTPDDVNAIGLPELLVLKLIPFRDIDRVHIRDMIHVGLIDDALAGRIPPELRPRLEEIRANPDG